MLAISSTELADFFEEVYFMLDFNPDLLEEGVLPEAIIKKGKEIVDRWGKVDTKKRINKIEKQLKDSGIAVNVVKSVATKHAKAAGAELRSVKDPKKAGTILKKHFRKGESEIQKELTDAQKMGLSVGMLLVIFFLNSFLLTVLQILCLAFGINPLVGTFITGMFVAPLTEETGKFLSIKQKATGHFFIVFNAFEYALYVFQAPLYGVSYLNMAIARVISVGVHGVLTFVQVKAREKAERTGDEKHAKEGWKVAFILHGLWNMLAGLGRFAQT